MLCITCNQTLLGMQKLFCSRKCKEINNLKKHKLINKHSFKGSNNPAWKGGTHHWQAGKLGRDKDGLSWKIQRKLAWERDSYTCQHCGATGGKRNPDVHHINPYRLSFSHALDNLIALCQGCHKKAEAKIAALWGGHTLQPPRPKKKEERLCVTCNRPTKSKINLCRSCNQATSARPRKDSVRVNRVEAFKKVAFPMRLAGRTCEEIGEALNITRQGVAERFRHFILLGLFPKEGHINCNDKKRRKCPQCGGPIALTRRRPSSVCAVCAPKNNCDAIVQW